jgi:hypothetical protein
VNDDHPRFGDVSRRYVDASVSCMSYPITEGIYGNETYVMYDNGTHKINQTFLDPPGPGGIGFATTTNSTCGNRCTDLLLYQAIPLPGDQFTNITEPIFYACQSTLYDVVDNYVLDVPSYGRIPDELARVLAGAIGWSGVPLPTINSPLQYQSYPESSPVGFFNNVDASGMQGLIADFTIGTLAALDDPKLDGPRIVVESYAPTPAEYLHVMWWEAGALLITIPCVQFVTLFIVIHWANRAIIKDDSHLAAAKLYHRLFTRKNLADHGCMLKGHEIVEAMGNPMVAYGWSEAKDIGHTDVFEEGSGMDTKSKFREGIYDGVRWEPYTDVEDAISRTLDARDYF